MLFRSLESRKPAPVGDDGETSESSSTNTEKDRQDDETHNTLSMQLEDLFSAVMVATDVDARPLHTDFQLLPSKRAYPDYYQVTEHPIDLKIIATKIQSGSIFERKTNHTIPSSVLKRLKHSYVCF